MTACGEVDARAGGVPAIGGATPSTSLRERELLKQGSVGGKFVSSKDLRCRVVA